MSHSANFIYREVLNLYFRFNIHFCNIDIFQIEDKPFVGVRSDQTEKKTHRLPVVQKINLIKMSERIKISIRSFLYGVFVFVFFSNWNNRNCYPV